MVDRRRARGFTLIELLIVLALMFIGLLGLMGLQVVAMRANGGSRAMTEAVSLAQDRLESIEHTPFAALASSGKVVEEQLGPQGVVAAGGAYTRTTTTTHTATQATFAVQVSWLDATGRAHALTLNAMRTP